MNSTLAVPGLNKSSSRENMQEEEIDDGNRSVIMEIIGQLRNGSELSKITLPTFILEPRSMCERLCDFFTYQEFLLSAKTIEDPAKRLLQLVRWIFSGHHTRPKGVKKPFNPILGEFFRCAWKERDGSEAFYLCEQTSHHPPQSNFFYANPASSVYISGELKPKARFLGNSAGTTMEGGSTIYLADIDEYEMSNPNIYARSILIGKMFMELGDTCTIKSKRNDIQCTLEFKCRGMFGGTNDKDIVTGKLTKISTGEVLYKISGKWSGATIATCKADGKESILFDGTREPIKEKELAALSDQEEFESRRLWQYVETAVKQGDHLKATEEKTKIEDNQRVIVKERSEGKGAAKKNWRARFFVKDPTTGEWDPIILPLINENRKKGELIPDSVIRDFVFSKPTEDIHKHFWVASK